MKDYLGNRWIRAALVIMAVGWTPLLAIIFLADAGLWPDPNPNPVGPGILFAFTGWPAIICFVIGFVRVKRARRPRGAAIH